MSGSIRLRLVHLSDTHISPHGQFVEEAFDEAVRQINRLDPSPTVIIHTGDLTDNGVLSDYEYAMKKIQLLEGKLVIVPGNHDERNYGQSLFRDLIGELDREVNLGDLRLYVMNSPEPDRDEGRLGRRRQEFLNSRLRKAPKDAIKIVSFHHHLVPVPHSGRETNVLEDAGEVLDNMLKYRVDLVLMGHRHVGRVLRIGDTILLNAGTTSSIRTRGRLGHTFNIVDVMEDGSIKIYERDIIKREDRIKAEYPRLLHENP
ncbi:MAG: metallophosphoesterase [Candidatus Bathyarchaeia archaeon]|nr:metallophosphoesterase [Candidatus Bathyarchaeota archaeon]